MGDPVTPLRGIRALLVDLEGTVYQHGRLIPGAVEALAAAEKRGIPHRFVTNTTSRPRSVIVRDIAAMGLVVDPDALFTAPRAARAYLLGKGHRRVHMLARPTLLEDLEGIESVDAGADAVLLGDLGEGMTFARLNSAFRLLLEGAELVTLARNRYWKDRGGLMLDIGAFAAALEYGSNKKATLVGKPAPAFFAAALASLGVAPAEAAVVGDDLESDVHGGQAAGMRGILVRTGKFREGDLERTEVRPDAVLDSLADLARVL
jgi:HAD superfamily hydrolase (TIGR01458 family)